MLTLSDKEVKNLRRLRSAARAFLQELESINLDPVPEKPRARQNLKDERIEQYERMYATGTWRKPPGLKKRPKKRA